MKYNLWTFVGDIVHGQKHNSTEVIYTVCQVNAMPNTRNESGAKKSKSGARDGECIERWGYDYWGIHYRSHNDIK